jgi:hypothetical protein
MKNNDKIAYIQASDFVSVEKLINLEHRLEKNPKLYKNPSVQNEILDYCYSYSSRACVKDLLKLGYKVKLFLKSNLRHLPLTKDTFVKGTIDTMRNAWKLLGVPQPKNIDIPKSIRKFAKRKVWETTLGELNKNEQTVFIKPLLNQKLFNGNVYKFHGNGNKEFIYRNIKWNVDMKHRNLINKNFPVLASTPIPLTHHSSRIVVYKGKIVGDHFFPHDTKKFAKEIIKAYKDAPIFYVIDVDWKIGRIREPNDLVLIEVNDGFSAVISNMYNSKIAEMNLARWDEIVSAKK